MEKIFVNVESFPSIHHEDYTRKQDKIAPGCYIVSLTIGDKHFIDNQYWNLQEAIDARLKLIEKYDNFEMGKGYIK